MEPRQFWTGLIIQTVGGIIAVIVTAYLLDALRRQDPAVFAWRVSADGRHVVDLLLGSDRPRRALEAGAAPAEVLSGWDEEARAFRERCWPLLLYDGSCGW